MINISQHDIRFILSTYSILFVSILKFRSRKLLILSSIFIILLGFGVRHLMIIVFNILLNILLFKMAPNAPLVGFFINIIYLYLYKYFGLMFIPDIAGTFDISGIIMINSIKSSYLLADNDFDSFKALEYLLHPAGLFTGPIPSYKDFKTYSDKIPSLSFPFPFKDLFSSFFHLFIYGIGRNYHFMEDLKNKNLNFFYKLIILSIYNFCNRSRFYFAWNLSHCVFCMFGHDNLKNTDCLTIETAPDVRTISRNWNRFVTVFLKRFVFQKLICHGKYVAALGCFVFSAIFHNYKLPLILFTLSIMVFGNINDFSLKFLKFKIFKIIQTFLMISYFSILFFNQSLKEAFLIWKGMYFFIHIYLGIWSIFYLLSFLKEDKKHGNNIRNEKLKEKKFK